MTKEEVIEKLHKTLENAMNELNEMSKSLDLCKDKREADNIKFWSSVKNMFCNAITLAINLIKDKCKLNSEEVAEKLQKEIEKQLDSSSQIQGLLGYCDEDDIYATHEFFDELRSTEAFCDGITTAIKLIKNNDEQKLCSYLQDDDLDPIPF